MGLAAPPVEMRIPVGLCLRFHAVRATLKPKAVDCHPGVPIPTVGFPERNHHGRVAVKQIKGFALIWNIGIMEYWKDGFKGKRTMKIFFPILSPITPSLQYSNPERTVA